MELRKNRSYIFQFFILLAVMCVCVYFNSPSAEAADIYVTNPALLQKNIDSASSGDIVYIGSDMVLPTSIAIPEGKEITIKSATGYNFTISYGYGCHFSVEGSLILENLTIDGINQSGGGIEGDNYGNITLQSGAVIQNCGAYDGYSGGGIGFDFGVVTMNDGSSIHNCSSWGGGAVANWADGTFIMNGGEIYDNSATLGGAIKVGNGSFIMNGGEIYNNRADSAGGAIYGGNITINKGIIRDNYGYYGGGIYVDYYGLITANDVVFSGNTAYKKFDPPSRADAIFPNIKYVTSSVTNADGSYVHPLNNYDIVYTGTADIYSLTYDPNGGSGSTVTNWAVSPYYSSHNNVFHIQSADSLEITRTGYTFLYWSTTKDNQGTIYKSSNELTISEDVTLYAIWGKSISSYISGYSDGTVKPEAQLTRGEAANIFYNLFSDEQKEQFKTSENSFSDVPSTIWSNEAISTLTNAGIITGYSDRTFKPEDKITRAELLTIATRFYDVSDPAGTTTFVDSVNHWAKAYIGYAQENGWVSGYLDGTFLPDNNIIRAETMKIINNISGRACDAEAIADVKNDIKKFSDNSSSAWYYYDVVAATNSYTYIASDSGSKQIWFSVD